MSDMIDLLDMDYGEAPKATPATETAPSAGVSSGGAFDLLSLIGGGGGTSDFSKLGFTAPPS